MKAIETQRCIGECKQIKPLSEFGTRKAKRSAGGYSVKTTCRTCYNIYQRDWKRANGQYKPPVISEVDINSKTAMYAGLLKAMVPTKKRYTANM